MSSRPIDYQTLREMSLKGQIHKIFFYRVCGTGMGNAAVLLAQKGYHVEGADSDFFPPMGDYLKKAHIKTMTMKDLTDDYLKTFDLIVVGNVVAKNSPCALRIEKLEVPYTSFPAALGTLVLEDKMVVGIAGTHGKTTTTYLLVQLFQNLGIDPGYLIGGVIDDGVSAYLGKDSLFFIEADEYDSAYFHKISKFHYYSLNHLILTSLEFDHGDIFNSVEDIKNQFRGLFPKITHSFVMSHDYPHILELEQEGLTSTHPLYYYGEKSDVGPFDILMDDKGSCFSLVLSGQKELFKTNLVGVHNILNLTSAILFAFSQGIALEKIRKAIVLLKKVKRRQEVKGYYKGATIIDDFGHHPTAVDITLKGLAIQYRDKKILAVFAPTSATSRSALFEKEFADSLRKASSVILVQPTAPTTLKEVGNMDCKRMSERLVPSSFSHVPIVSTLSDLTQSVKKVLSGEEKDWVVVFFSNGGLLGFWESDFAKNLTSL